MPFVLIPIIVIVVVLLSMGLFVVKQQNVYIIERLGKFSHTARAGLNFKIPVIDRVVARIDLRTGQLDFALDAKTADNVTITLSIASQYHVDTSGGTTSYDSGVCRAYYRLQAPVAQMRAYLTDALRSAVPKYTLDDVFGKKDEISMDVNQSVADLMREYGYILDSTLITSIQLPIDVEQSMNRINSAQREKAAAQDLAEAERIKVVTEAKASAEAAEQVGIGIANQRKAIAQGISDSLETIKASGVSTEEANKLFLFTQWTDMMEKFAKGGNASTVILPSDFEKTASMFDQIVCADKATKNQ